MLHREWWRVEVGEHYPTPAGFGMAYYDAYRRLSVCWRWPLNHIVAWVRWFWFRYLHAAPLEEDLAVRRAMGDTYTIGYQSGHYDGYHEGYVAGMDAAVRWRTGLDKAFAESGKKNPYAEQASAYGEGDEDGGPART